MGALSTTKLSSKGQVVIPEEIRESLGLKPGAQFVVMGSGDTVVLKMIVPPSPEDFKEMLRKVHKEARQSGMKKRDVDAAVRKVRATR
jgi:AbrB family looped-hinge helix DNA binding protein